MTFKITGINTGVIHDARHFIALALKIVSQDAGPLLLFIPARPLRDLLVCLEYRLHQQSLRTEEEKSAFRQHQEKAAQALLANSPSLAPIELAQAHIRWQVESIEPQFSEVDETKMVFRIRGADTVVLTVENTQIALLVRAVMQAMSSAGMGELSLRLASLPDFLPLYDADYQDDNRLNYDTYTHPAWKLPLFQYTLLLAYRYTDEEGEYRFAGTVIKARVRPDDDAAKALARRLLAFSPRLKKLEGRSCQVSVRTLSAKEGELSGSQYLHSLWQLRQDVLTTAANG